MAQCLTYFVCATFYDPLYLFTLCRVLRELAGVEQHDFIDQLCGDQALRLLSPSAHSNAMFFLSADERFIVRTITCAEKKLLLSVLQRYAEHLRR